MTAVGRSGGMAARRFGFHPLSRTAGLGGGGEGYRLTALPPAGWWRGEDVA